MDRVLQRVLRSFIQRGTLRLTTARGTTWEFGDGSGKPVVVRFTTPAAERAVLFDPELAVGECYMDGTLVIDQGSLADLLELAMSQDASGKPPRWARPQWLIRYILRRLAQFNVPLRSRRNVAHHYDLDGRLYALFLDADRQYSCAYFEHRVLDIGSGWGGLGLYLAEICGARVTGVTLSQEQHKLSRARAEEKGLGG